MSRPAPVGQRLTRVRALLALQARVQWRYGIVALVAVLAAAWTALLLALPVGAARAAAPWLLLLETALVGTTVAGAVVILERDQGMRAALALTPARTGERLAAKVGLLAALVTVSAVPVALAGRPVNGPGLVAALVGVGLTATLTLLLAVALAAHRQSAITFMIALPLVLLPLLAPALAHAAGLTHPLLYAAPTTGAMDLVRSGYDPAAAPGWSVAWPAVGAVAWLLLATVVAAGIAHQQLRRFHRGRPIRTSGRGAGVVRRRGGPVRSFLAADLASLRRDPLLILIASSPVLLGLGLRFGYQPAHDWLAGTHGLDLNPYRPLLLGAAILLHVPVSFGMIGALLVLDDADDRALLALRTSPLSLPRYLGYRAGLVAVAAGVGAVAATGLSGLAAPGWWWRMAPALLLAGLIAPLFLLTVLAVARNKVAGVAAIKLLGLPFYAPLVAWWLPGPVGWLFAWLPTWWLLRAAWHGWQFALVGAAVTIVALVLLTRRVLPRLATS